MTVWASLLASPAAARAPVAYARTDRPVQGVELRTRGYLNDDCLARDLWPCLAFTNDALFRQEATAQANAIRFLQGGSAAYAPPSPLRRAPWLTACSGRPARVPTPTPYRIRRTPRTRSPTAATPQS